MRVCVFLCVSRSRSSSNFIKLYKIIEQDVGAPAVSTNVQTLAELCHVQARDAVNM
jgi:hypothetical protein